MVLLSVKRLHARSRVVSTLRDLSFSVVCSLLLAACAIHPVPDPRTTPYADAKAPLAASPWALSSGVSNLDTDGSANAGGARQTVRVAVGLVTGPAPVWHYHKLPGKHANHFTPVFEDGRDAMLVQSDSSASLLRQRVHVAAQQLGNVKFSWIVPALIANADMAFRDTDDSPVRIVLAFEGDRSRFSDKNAIMSELSHTLTGEPLPFATLM